MISTSKSTFSLNNLKILRLKVTKNHMNLLKKFCEFRPCSFAFGQEWYFHTSKQFSPPPSSSSSCPVSILPRFSMVLFCMKELCTIFFIYSLALYFFSTRILAQKLLVECWWNWLIFMNSFLCRFPYANTNCK